MLELPSPRAALAELTSAALSADAIRPAHAFASFAVHCRCVDALFPLADLLVIAQRLAFGSSDFIQTHMTPML